MSLVEDYRSWIIIAGMVMFVGLILFVPIIGLIVYASSIPIDYCLALAGFNTTGVFSIGQGSLVALTLVAAGRLLSNRPSCSREGRGVYVWSFLLVGVVWMSSLFAFSPKESFYMASVLTAMTFLPFMITMLVTTERQLQALWFAVGLSGALSAGIGILQYANVLQPGITAGASAAQEKDRRGGVTDYTPGQRNVANGQRYAGPTGNPNGYGEVLMTGIPALVFFLFAGRSKLLKTSAALGLAACLFSLLLTMSRTNILGCLVFLLLTAFGIEYKSKLKKMLLVVFILMGVTVFVGAMFLVEGVGDRLAASVQDGGDSSTDARWSVMGGGVKAALAHPLLGIGPNNTYLAGYNPTGNASHDIVSAVLGELGVAGVITCIGLIWATSRLFKTIRKLSGETQLRNMGIILKSALVAWLIEGFGTTVYDLRPLWTIIALTLALHEISVRTQSANGAEV